MPKKPLWPPQAKLHHGKMRCWFRGRWWHLGDAGDEPKWKAKLSRLVSLWSIDPAAADRRAADYLVIDLFTDFLESADAPEKGKAQRDRYKTVADLLDSHHAAKVEDFGPREFKAWLRALAGLLDADDVQRFNRTSIKHFAGCVRRVWRWGVENRNLPPTLHQALQSVTLPKESECRPPNVVRPPVVSDVEKVIPDLPPVPRAVVKLLRLTAARPTELLILRPCDVNRDGAFWRYTPESHKNKHRKKHREITFGPEAQAILAPWLEGVPTDGYAFSPKRNAERLDEERDAARPPAKYPSEERRRLRLKAQRKIPNFAPRYDHRSLLHAVNRACLRCGVQPFSSYSLRHLRATEVRADHSLEHARALLGHSAKSMTDDYSRDADRKLQEQVAK